MQGLASRNGEAVSRKREPHVADAATVPAAEKAPSGHEPARVVLAHAGEPARYNRGVVRDREDLDLDASAGRIAVGRR